MLNVGKALQVYRISAEHMAYLESCARIRNISMAGLLTRLITVIARDQLVLSVLDDDSRPERERGEHGWHPQRKPRHDSRIASSSSAALP